MNWRNISTVFGKEVKETFRDKTVIFNNFIFPFVYFIVWVVIVSSITVYKTVQEGKQISIISWATTDRMYNVFSSVEKNKSFSVSSSTFEKDNQVEIHQLLKTLDRETKIAAKISEQVAQKKAVEKKVRDEEATIQKELELTQKSLAKGMAGQKIDIIVLSEKFGQDGHHLHLVYDPARESSILAHERLMKIVRTENDLLLKKRLDRIGRDASFINPYHPQSAALTSEIKASGITLSKVAGILVALLLLLAMYYPAINATIGEKTKFTLRPLLMNPVQTSELLLGKYLNIAFQGILGVLPYLFNVFLTVVLLNVTKKLPIFSGLENIINYWPLCLALFSFALLISATCFLVTILARTLPQAQGLLGSVMTVLLLPALFLITIEIKLGLLISLCPYMNFIVLIQDFMIGDVPGHYVVMVVISNIVYSVCLVGLATQIFNYQMVWSTGHFTLSEMISFKRIKLETPNPALSFLLFICIFLGIFYSATSLGKNLQWQLLINPLIFSLGFSIFFLKYYQLEIVKSLGIKAFSFKQGLGAFYLAMVLVPLILPFASLFTIPEEVAKGLTEIMGSGKFTPTLWYKLLTIALFAGVCEEIAFRGVILRGLLSSFPPFFSVLVTSAMFGLVHFDLVRFFPTFAIGLLLGVVALRAGLLPCMIIHVLYNALLVIIDHYQVPVQLLIAPGSTSYNVIYYCSLIATFVFSLKLLKKGPRTATIKISENTAHAA